MQQQQAAATAAAEAECEKAKPIAEDAVRLLLQKEGGEAFPIAFTFLMSLDKKNPTRNFRRFERSFLIELLSGILCTLPYVGVLLSHVALFLSLSLSLSIIKKETSGLKMSLLAHEAHA
jgi:hypothetical protein